jgi:hypothetical protein
MVEDSGAIIGPQDADDSNQTELKGGLALYGVKDLNPIQHEFNGQVIHRTAPESPLVHVVGWSSGDEVEMILSGRVELTNTRETPLHVRLAHEFPEIHRQSHEVTIAPVDHTLKVNTRASDPIHHALQLLTPLQLRFCNVFLVKSDYRIIANVNGATMVDIHLSGETTIIPQPCDDEGPGPVKILTTEG